MAIIISSKQCSNLRNMICYFQYLSLKSNKWDVCEPNYKPFTDFLFSDIHYFVYSVRCLSKMIQTSIKPDALKWEFSDLTLLHVFLLTFLDLNEHIHCYNMPVINLSSRSPRSSSSSVNNNDCNNYN